MSCPRTSCACAWSIGAVHWRGSHLWRVDGWLRAVIDRIFFGSAAAGDKQSRGGCRDQSDQVLCHAHSIPAPNSQSARRIIC